MRYIGKGIRVIRRRIVEVVQYLRTESDKILLTENGNKIEL